MKVCMVYAISVHVIPKSWLVSNSPLGSDSCLRCRPPGSCSHVFHLNQPRSVLLTSPTNTHIFIARESVLERALSVKSLLTSSMRK